MIICLIDVKVILTLNLHSVYYKNQFSIYMLKILIVNVNIHWILVSPVPFLDYVLSFCNDVFLIPVIFPTHCVLYTAFLKL